MFPKINYHTSPTIILLLTNILQALTSCNLNSVAFNDACFNRIIEIRSLAMMFPSNDSEC